MIKRLFVAAIVGLCALAAHAAYPERPVRLIVPFPAGSGTDIVARQLAEEMSRGFGQPVIVDNKPGAQGIIGVNAAVAAPPDGYTLLVLGVTTGASNVTLFRKLPYDPMRDLTALGMIAESPIALVAAPGFAANDTAGLFELARKNPGKLTWGYGSGSAQIAAAKLVSGLEQLNADLGVPTPAAYGIDEATWNGKLELMAEQALASGSPGNNPRVPEKAEITALYREVWTGSRSNA